MHEMEMLDGRETAVSCVPARANPLTGPMAGEGPHIRVLTARIATARAVRPLDCAGTLRPTTSYRASSQTETRESMRSRQWAACPVRLCGCGVGGALL